jgi:hypothetical protein
MTATDTDWSVSASRLKEIRLQEGGRMTDLVETVCVVTNVSLWNDELRSPHKFVWGIAEPEPGSITKEATEKTETTDVVEIKTLSFMWNGKAYTNKCERVLSSKVRRWKREDAWAEVVEPERK